MRATIRSMRELARRLADGVRDASGAAAVEFALTVVPFLGFVFAIFQVALYHFALQSLDAATRTVSRRIMTGAVQSQGLTAAQFRDTQICPGLKIALDCSKIVVSVSKVAKISSAATSTGIYAFIQQNTPALAGANLDATKSKYCLGGPGDYVFIDITYPFLNVGSFIQKITGRSFIESMTLRSTNFIYNEPFQASSGSTQTNC